MWENDIIIFSGDASPRSFSSLSNNQGLPPPASLIRRFMRSAHPSAWFQRSNKKSQTPEPDQSLKQQPFPYLSSSSSRPAAAPTLFTSLHLHARNKDSPRPSSAASLRSAYSAASGSHHSTLHTHTHTQDLYSHPFASMVHAPLPVVSSHDSSDEEEECPVCLEPLSFSFRLPGEKPHIVPECGHALHEVSEFHFSLPLPVYGRLRLRVLWALDIRVTHAVGEMGGHRYPIPKPQFSLMGILGVVVPPTLLDCSISGLFLAGLVSAPYPSHLIKFWCSSTDLICNFSCFIQR